MLYSYLVRCYLHRVAKIKSHVCNSICTSRHVCIFTNENIKSNEEKQILQEDYSASDVLSSLISHYPKNLSRSTSKPLNLYAADSSISDLLIEHLRPSIAKNTPILEACPGPGIITKALLKAGAKHLKVYERRQEFHPTLQDLKSQFPLLEIFNEDIYFLSKIEARGKFAGEDTVGQILPGINYHQWHEDAPFHLFGILSSRYHMSFMRYLFSRLCTMTSIFSYGRCEFIFFMTSSEYQFITATPGDSYHLYRSSTVLYNLLLDIKLLDKVSNKLFLPRIKNSKKEMEDNNLYLVKLTPRIDLFENVAPREKLPELYYFVKQCMVSRSALVIPFMEKWIPNCGPRIIKEGIPVFSQFGNLSPQEILNLFHCFISWEDYNECAFKMAAENWHIHVAHEE